MSCISSVFLSWANTSAAASELEKEGLLSVFLCRWLYNLFYSAIESRFREILESKVRERRRAELRVFLVVFSPHLELMC